MTEMHQRWGKLPVAEIAAPAIALAKRGLPQDWYTTLKVASSAPILRLYPESARIYLRDGCRRCRPIRAGSGYFRLGKLRRDAGAARAGRAGAISTRRDRGGDRRRRERAMGGVLSMRGPARAARRASRPPGGRVARAHAATHRAAHRGADRGRRLRRMAECAPARRPTPPGTRRSRAR